MNGTQKAPYGQPALVGGAVMGVLSALPIVAGGNLCCCLWVVSGGVVAAYLLQQNQAAPIEPVDAAIVGLFAGLIGAVIQVALSIPIDALLGPMQREVIRRALDMAGDVPPNLRDMFENADRIRRGPIALILRYTLALFFWLFAGGVFSTLGGLLGMALFRKPRPPSTTIDV